MRLQGTPASLPLPVTRRGEREPAEQPSQRLLHLVIEGRPRPHRLIRDRIHPVGRTPDADIDAGLRGINTPAILAAPDDHGLGRGKQLIIAAPSRRPGASQHRTRRLLKRRVRDPPLARAGLYARQFPDDSPEPLDANTTSRRSRRQLVVVAAADELKPALGTGPLTALIEPHRSAADAARDRQATGRLHEINICSVQAAGTWPTPGPARSRPGWPCRRVRPPGGARAAGACGEPRPRKPPPGELGFVLPGMRGEPAAPRCGGGAVGPDGPGPAGVLRGGRQISSAWSLMPREGRSSGPCDATRPAADVTATAAVLTGQDAT